MPKAPKNNKVVHPNSRTAGHLMRKQSHIKRVDKHQTEKATKIGLMGEKLLWFQEHLEEDKISYSTDEARELIERYLNRFDDELEQISIKHSIGSHRSQQHIVRKQSIEMTMKQEREMYDGPGFEIPDILTVKNTIALREWTQELRYIQNIKIIKVKSTKATDKKIDQALNLRRQEQMATTDEPETSDKNGNMENDKP